MQQSRAACMEPAFSGMSMQQARLDHRDGLVVCMAQHTSVSLGAGSNSLMSKQDTAMCSHTLPNDVMQLLAAVHCQTMRCSYMQLLSLVFRYGMKVTQKRSGVQLVLLVQ